MRWEVSICKGRCNPSHLLPLCTPRCSLDATQQRDPLPEHTLALSACFFSSAISCIKSLFSSRAAFSLSSVSDSIFCRFCSVASCFAFISQLASSNLAFRSWHWLWLISIFFSCRHPREAVSHLAVAAPPSTASEH